MRYAFAMIHNALPFVLAGAAALGLSLIGCASSPAAGPATADAEPPKKPPSLLGPVSREQVEAAEPDWVAAEVDAEVDAEAALALAGVPGGAAVTVYFGTWCGDSRRELARFWAAADQAGYLPFAIDYIAVDRYDQRPPALEQEVGLRWVPTFIVERDGEEVGRLVEVSPNGVEHDLLALLTGQATGVVSAREDLGGSGSH